MISIYTAEHTYHQNQRQRLTTALDCGGVATAGYNVGRYSKHPPTRDFRVAKWYIEPIFHALKAENR